MVRHDIDVVVVLIHFFFWRGGFFCRIYEWDTATTTCYTFLVAMATRKSHIKKEIGNLVGSGPVICDILKRPKEIYFPSILLALPNNNNSPTADRNH